MKYADLKKGDKILSKQLGTPISGKLLESPKQGKGLKKTILILGGSQGAKVFGEIVPRAILDLSKYQAFGRPTLALYLGPAQRKHLSPTILGLPRGAT